MAVALTPLEISRLLSSEVLLKGKAQCGARNDLLGGRLSTVDLLVLTSLISSFLNRYDFYQQAT
jgi:hypothetical protein